MTCTYLLVNNCVLLDHVRYSKEKLNAKGSKRDNLDAMESLQIKKRLRQAGFCKKTLDSAKKETMLKDAQSCKKKYSAMTPEQWEEKRLKDAQRWKEKRSAITPEHLDEEKLKDAQN